MTGVTNRRIELFDESGSLALAPVSRDDMEEVALIEADSNSPPWSHSLFLGELDNRFAAILGGYDRSGFLVGFILYHALGREAHILKFAVRQTHRGGGRGKEILHGTLERMRGMGIRWVTLEVRESNERARKVYESFGFSCTGVRPRYYSDNQESAVVMYLEMEP